jgi:hypothetical protein
MKDRIVQYEKLPFFFFFKKKTWKESSLIAQTPRIVVRNQKLTILDVVGSRGSNKKKKS